MFTIPYSRIFSALCLSHLALISGLPPPGHPFIGLVFGRQFTQVPSAHSHFQTFQTLVQPLRSCQGKILHAQYQNNKVKQTFVSNLFFHNLKLSHHTQKWQKVIGEKVFLARKYEFDYEVSCFQGKVTVPQKDRAPTQKAIGRLSKSEHLCTS